MRFKNVEIFESTIETCPNCNSLELAPHMVKHYLLEEQNPNNIATYPAYQRPYLG